MGTESDQIKKHIEEKREELGSRLNELEYRVKRATDWRAQVQQHPAAAIGAAFAGGLLVGIAL